MKLREWLYRQHCEVSAPASSDFTGSKAGRKLSGRQLIVSVTQELVTIVVQLASISTTMSLSAIQYLIQIQS